MKRAFNNIGQIGVYFFTSLLFVLIGIILLLWQEKTELHLALNTIHSVPFDYFFEYTTYLGDGLITALAVMPIGIYVYKKQGISTFVLGWGTLILVGILTQIGKRLIFPDAMRPVRYIGEEFLYLVPNVDIHEMNSFPSGHTATGFAFFAFVAFTLFRNQRMAQIGCAIVAVLIGYSRIYLSQHFMSDVVAGAMLGLFSFLIVHFITHLAFNRSVK